MTCGKADVSPLDKSKDDIFSKTLVVVPVRVTSFVQRTLEEGLISRSAKKSHSVKAKFFLP